MNLVICDIDGTLTIDDDTPPCLGDSMTKKEILRVMDPVRVAKLAPRPAIIKMLQDYFVAGHKIILITGRWEYLKPITISWLHAHQVKYHDLRMRAPSKWEWKSVNVKLDLFESVKTNNPTIWIDDDDEMLEAVAKLGVHPIKVIK